jgi:hypothetical protein
VLFVEQFRGAVRSPHRGAGICVMCWLCGLTAACQVAKHRSDRALVCVCLPPPTVLVPSVCGLCAAGTGRELGADRNRLLKADTS